jgi:pyruvate,water dikinase
MIVVDGLNDPRLGEAGAKVANLIRLSQELPVPPIVGLLQTSTNDFTLPTDLSDLLVNRDGGELYAVRSSANAEDTDAASFAGMFETILGVDFENLASAVRRVVESKSSRRVTQYCVEKGIEADSLQVAVGIQRMVRADVSGVAFSRSPTFPAKECLVEAVFGLGEPLVQGQITPESWRISRHNYTVVSVARSFQRDALTLQPTGGVAMTAVSSVDRRAPKLSADDARSLAAMAIRVERCLELDGADIEWAMEDGKMWLVQARPITAYNDQPMVGGRE